MLENPVKLFTVGFTKKSAAHFFSILQGAGVRHLIDTRLNNRSQLAGFSKGDDLPFFLQTIAQISYRHAPELAPTQDMLDRYKKLKGKWSEYESEFLALMRERGVQTSIELTELSEACLLCSEHEATFCHRRLVAEHLRERYPELQINHLV